MALVIILKWHLRPGLFEGSCVVLEGVNLVEAPCCPVVSLRWLCGPLHGREIFRVRSRGASGSGGRFVESFVTVHQQCGTSFSACKHSQP